MRGVAKGVESQGNSAECPRIGGDVPKALLETPMAEIPAKQQEVMADRHSLPAPLGDQTGGKGVAKIMNPRSVTCASRDEICRERTEGAMHSPLAKGVPSTSQE